MKICILSDSHDHYGHLQAAAEAAKAFGAEAILHCGDLVAPSTLKILQPIGLPVHVIHGNNSGDLYALTRLAAKTGSVVRYHGQDARLSLAERRVFLVHYPHYAYAMATTGDWDLVCCGHSHKPGIRLIANMKSQETLVINPGTVGGVGSDPATYVLGDLLTMQFHVETLSKG